MTGEAAGEVEFVRTTFTYAAGSAPPTYGGLQVTESDGTLGAWIGLAAAAGPAAGVSDGVWSWVKTDGSSAAQRWRPAPRGWFTLRSRTRTETTIPDCCGPR